MSNTKALASGVFNVKCYGADGKLKWEEENHNLVVNEGLQYMVASALDGFTPITTWYIGLYGAGASNAPAAGDTMASHAGWTEVVPYSQATRVQAVFGTATTANPSVLSNSASVAAFSINVAGPTTIGGAFLTSDSAKSGTTGTLFSASDFTGGDRSVISGDTLNVTYTFSLTAT